MEIAYVFHAAGSALMLDASGVCRWVVAKSGEVDERTKRCVGAQFVASLDPSIEGMLGHEPMIGKNALFARTDNGRISVVRFGPITKVEGLDDVPAETVRVPAATAKTLIEIDEDSESTLERPAARIELEELEDIVTSVPQSRLN